MKLTLQLQAMMTGLVLGPLEKNRNFWGVDVCDGSGVENCQLSC